MLRLLAIVVALALIALGVRFALMAAESRRGAARPRPAGGLAGCPGSPNCVSSQATDAAHRVAPLALSGPPEAAMGELRRIVETTPGARVLTAAADYLHATYSSRVFGFVDDLELLADPEAGVIQVRSASRTGYSDLGVNRRRVEKLRARFAAAG